MKTEDGIISLDDAQSIGLRIVEMAGRVRPIHAIAPGTRANWSFEMDGVRYNVVVTVGDKG